MSFEIIKMPNGRTFYVNGNIGFNVCEFMAAQKMLQEQCKTITYSNQSALEIINHIYEDDIKYDNKGNKITYKKTTLHFGDGTHTSVEAPADKADPYMGFYICYAKRMAGNDNTINDVAEHWIEDVPKKKAKEKAETDKKEQEKQRIQERDKKRREKKRIRLEAIRRKEQYDAAKLANEKYGVPMDFKSDKENI